MAATQAKRKATGAKTRKVTKKPSQKTVQQSAQASKSDKKTVKKVATSHLAALKNSVLNELNAMEKGTPESASSFENQKKKVPLAPPSFEEVLLPAMTRQLVKARYKAFFFKALLLVGAVALVGLFVVTGQRASGPAETWQDIYQAFEDRDGESFASHVDVSAVAASVVDQVFQVSGAEDDPLQQRLADVVRPGLVQQFEDHLLLWVEEGAENLQETAGILPQLLHEGRGLQVVGVQPSADNAQQLVLTFAAADLDIEVPVTLTMAKQEEGWVVSGVEGIQAALKVLTDAQEAKTEALQQTVQAKLAETLVVEEFSKAAGLSDFEQGKAVLLTVVLRNMAAKPVQSFEMKVDFQDAAGQSMKRFDLYDEDGIAAGATLEKTWTLLVDPAVKPESHIYALPQESLKVVMNPQVVTFVDGEVLALP